MESPFHIINIMDSTEAENVILKANNAALETENENLRKQNIRCIMCYVIQRTDVDAFQPSDLDPEYKEAVRLAHEAGVEIITMVVGWNRDGEAHFVRDDLPFVL